MHPDDPHNRVHSLIKQPIHKRPFMDRLFENRNHDGRQ
jgi:hypothetical protein